MSNCPYSEMNLTVNVHMVIMEGSCGVCLWLCTVRLTSHGRRALIMGISLRCYLFISFVISSLV